MLYKQFLSLCYVRNTEQFYGGQGHAQRSRIQSTILFEVSVTIYVFIWPVITIILLVLTNLITFMLYVNLLMQAQDRKIRSAISFDHFGLNNQKISKVNK